MLTADSCSESDHPFFRFFAQRKHCRGVGVAALDLLSFTNRWNPHSAVLAKAASP